MQLYSSSFPADLHTSDSQQGSVFNKFLFCIDEFYVLALTIGIFA